MIPQARSGSTSKVSYKKRHRREWAYNRCTGGGEEPRSDASSQVESEGSEPPPLKYIWCCCAMSFLSLLFISSYTSVYIRRPRVSRELFVNLVKTQSSQSYKKHLVVRISVIDILL
jgi:hypothetical protein